MFKILDEENEKRELAGREPLRDRIKLQRDSSGFSEFKIEGVIHAGGTCICYKAIRLSESGELDQPGTLKEVYPYEEGYRLVRQPSYDGETANQLYSEDSALSKLIELREEMCRPYKKLAQLNKLDKFDFDSFFAPTEIYRGIKKEGCSEDNYTLYIWCSGGSGVLSFDDHLCAMQKNIGRALASSEDNSDFILAQELHTVLQAFKALSLAVEKLHTGGLLHLDIKPANFGIRTLGSQTGDHVSVSLFDVNSIYEISSAKPPAISGTKGFASPEMLNGVASDFAGIHTPSSCDDIYSLGASVYNSIVILSEKERGIYNEDPESIEAAVNSSMLISGSEYNSKTELVDILVEILTKSLTESLAEKYRSVKAFYNDISRADTIVCQQIEQAKRYGNDKKVTVSATDKEAYYNEKIDTGATGAIQCLLYNHPLYDYVSYNEKAVIGTDGCKSCVTEGYLNLLVVGGGVYSRRFIDIAFEMSQIRNCFLNITVITNERERDKKRYLSTRPEFVRYFSVDGSEPECDSYGRIEFVGIKPYGRSKTAEFGMKRDNSKIIEATIGTGRQFSYVFVSVSDDSLNKKIAGDLKNYGGIICGEKGKAVINYVCYPDDKRSFSKEEDDGLLINPVAVGATISSHKDYEQLKRMAFNCHLLWDNNFNVDIKNSYSEFRKKYNFSSSLSLALSIKYKLYSIGIDMREAEEKSGSERARLYAKYAQECKEKLLSPGESFPKGSGEEESKAFEKRYHLTNELTMYEHKRWMVNLICQSYRMMPEDYIEKLTDTNKDKKKLLHSCMRRSSAVWALNSGKWKDAAFWDDAYLLKSEEFEQLDDLDRISVLLHRHFMDKANAFSFEKQENQALEIRRCLRSRPDILAAFDAYRISMLEVKNHKQRENTAMESYKICYQRLLSMLDSDVPEAKAVKNLLYEIERDFAPVRMAYEFTDYKAIDQTLIRNLPFILNYHATIHLCIPFVIGEENDKWFRNVASCLVIKPGAVTYMVRLDSENTWQKFTEAFGCVARVMDSHRLQTKLSFVFFSFGTGLENGEMKRRLREISESRIEKLELIEVTGRRDFRQRISDVLRTSMSFAESFTAIEDTDSAMSEAILDAVIADSLPIPDFKFISADGSFETDSDDYCLWFNDIPFKAHLDIDDMFVLNNRTGEHQEPELYKDYLSIWEECYCSPTDGNEEREQKAAAWKRLCTSLRTAAKKQDRLAAISLSKAEKCDEDDGDTVKKSGCKTDFLRETTLFVPAYCKSSALKIFKFLSSRKNNPVKSYSIIEHNSVTLRIVFESNKYVADKIKGIFSVPYLLSDERYIETVYSPSDNTACIFCNSLSVRGISCKKFADGIDLSLRGRVERLLSWLCEKGYIIISGKINFEASTDETASFDICFSSPQIKELLTVEGKILELYTYYKVLEGGYFDQVKTGVKIKCERDGESFKTQEFDLVTVKGMRSQMIEIKGCKKLSPEFYTTLKANGDKYGINKRLILVSDLTESSEAVNRPIISKGKDDYRIDTIGVTDAVGERLKEMMSE